jgi:GT2 family glycosyltransferase
MLSIVFLNYNRLSETRHTLEQLQKICANRFDIEISDCFDYKGI